MLFRSSLGVKLRIEVARNVHELIEKLLTGKGDLIAYNLPITKEWKDSLLYCCLLYTSCLRLPSSERSK